MTIVGDAVGSSSMSILLSEEYSQLKHYRPMKNVSERKYQATFNCWNWKGIKINDKQYFLDLLNFVL